MKTLEEVKEEILAMGNEDVWYCMIHLPKLDNIDITLHSKNSSAYMFDGTIDDFKARYIQGTELSDLRDVIDFILSYEQG